ncbi:MAG: glycosyltransferase [bacterium]|nr:glycosyltransferase [bacterium]
MKKGEKIVVSVIIPVKEIGYYLLHENLPSFLEQTYKKFEVLVLPNDHTQYDISLLKKYAWLRIIPTGKITRPAAKRDIGVRNARGTIIAFLDDDAYASPLWLEQAMNAFKKNKVAAVCGPGIIPADNRINVWEHIFDEILVSWIGSGSYTYRFTPEKERLVDDYPSMNFIIKKATFRKAGGFNMEFWPGEDSKLCETIVYKLKEKILYNPSVLIYHHRRNDLKDFLVQHGNYGFHRGAFFAHGDKNSKRIIYIIPTLFTIYIFFLILIFFSFFFFHTPFSYAFLLPLSIYAICAAYIVFRSMIYRHNMLLSFITPFILFLNHVYYGIRFIEGYSRGIVKKKSIY